MDPDLKTAQLEELVKYVDSYFNHAWTLKVKFKNEFQENDLLRINEFGKGEEIINAPKIDIVRMCQELCKENPSVEYIKIFDYGHNKPIETIIQETNENS